MFQVDSIAASLFLSLSLVLSAHPMPVRLLSASASHLVWPCPAFGSSTLDFSLSFPSDLVSSFYQHLSRRRPFLVFLLPFPSLHFLLFLRSALPERSTLTATPSPALASPGRHYHLCARELSDGGPSLTPRSKGSISCHRTGPTKALHGLVHLLLYLLSHCYILRLHHSSSLTSLATHHFPLPTGSF